MGKTTDFAKLTFPETINVDTNQLLRDSIYFEIGDIRDICSIVEVSELFEGGLSFSLKKTPGTVTAYETPHNQRSTFCKGVHELLLPDGKYHMLITEMAYFCANS